ncbi:MAG: hypothetical protein HGA19_22365, partial [Oscillochloris sp.]|nr:hypothetical protein [Oscillochloris sp.]
TLIDQETMIGHTFYYTFASNTFIDEDTDDSLTYSATMAGGALPSWLSFSPSTRTFRGIPTADDIGTLDIMVTATDSGGLSTDMSFTLTVAITTDPQVIVYLPMISR